MFSSNKNNILLVSILFILIGIFLRIYQLNFENYWLDEMTSFWVADPNLSLEDTFTRNNHFHTPPIFDLFLKKYLEFFSYDPEIGRHVPFFWYPIDPIFGNTFLPSFKKQFFFIIYLFNKYKYISN